jgi:hypothetical protein
MSGDDSTVLLNGLDGANPLAFLAALGTQRALAEELQGETPTIAWEEAAGGWKPRIHLQRQLDPDGVIAQLDARLHSAATRASFQIGDNLNLNHSDFRSHVLAACCKLQTATNSDREDADFLAAFGCEACFGEDGVIQDTSLRTMSGAGHQHFLKFFRDLVDKTDASQLHRALFQPWDYADEGRGLNLRWDPADDRRYALRWDDPSGDPVRTMRGANRLAIEAMPLLPTMPTPSGLRTTCFEGTGARNTFFTWPIWSRPSSLDVVRSLLQQCSSIRQLPERERTAIGVSAMFSSQRITTGKFRNFTPARAV